MPYPGKSQRFKAIDSLRAIAALLVLWMHVTELFVKTQGVAEKGTLLFDVAYALDFGRVGVVVFFAISGFVICSSLTGEVASGTRRFFIRRVLRLYPAFWLSVILSAILFVVVLNRPIGIDTFFANLTMLPLWFAHNQILGLYWTLETELVFYLLCWLLFIFGLNRSAQALFLSMASLLALFGLFMFNIIPQPQTTQWQAMPYHLSIMLWGGLFRCWYDQPSKRIFLGPFQVQLLHLLALASFIVASPAIYSIVKYTWTQDFGFIRYGIPYLLGLLIFVVFTLWLPIRSRAFVWLGAISYSLYLFHPLIFHALEALLPFLPDLFSSLHLSFYLMITIAFSIILSAMVYIYIEKPAIALSRRWTRSRSLEQAHEKQHNTVT